MSAGPDDYGRRTWNLKDYEKKDSDDEAGTSDQQEKQAAGPKPQSCVKPREGPVDLESKLGKSVIISKATPTSQAGGFYCEVCECVVKDSIVYLDHINGKKHQRNLGFNIKKVQRSTLDDVEERFQKSLKKKDESVEEYNMQERLRELREEEEKAKEYRRNQRKEKKKRKREEVDEVDDDEMAKLMGFSSFSSKK